MKKGKLILAAVALLALFFIGGTMAYFTDTKQVTNTFTLGDVKITLTEPSYVANNSNGLMPGAVIPKDPIITNVGTSSAYVFMKITEPCYDGNKIFDYQINAAWSVVSGAGTACGASGSGVTTAETVYAYGTSAQMTELPVTSGSNATPALFSQVTLKSTLTQTEVEALNTWDATAGNDIKIVVDGYAIQKDNLGSTASATVWTNF